MAVPIIGLEARPDIFQDYKTSFTVTNLLAREVNEDRLAPFLESRGDSPILGCSTAFWEPGEHSQFRRKEDGGLRMHTITFATTKKILHIHMPGLELEPGAPRPTMEALKQLVVLNDDLIVVGIHIDHAAVGLFLDVCEMQVSNFVDMHELNGKEDRRALANYHWLLGGKAALHMPAVNAIFGDVSNDEMKDLDREVARSALRAWACCIAATHGLAGVLTNAARIDTTALALNDMRLISKIHRDAASLDWRKPKTVKNDFADEWKITHEKIGTEEFELLHVYSIRFATRLRASLDESDGQIIHVEDENGQITEGIVTRTTGKLAQIRLPKGSRFNSIASISTVGKDNLTHSERSKEVILVRALEKKLKLTALKPFRAIWFPSVRATARPRAIPEGAISKPLNGSQKQAVLAVLREPLARDVDVQIVVGPPGSGKTSVIGACVQAITAISTSEKPRYVWLAAQSNVAVKNIARKLIDINFLDFKLLVSNDFFIGWHEHLYEKVQGNILTGRDFPGDIEEAAAMLAGTHVILCTLSMLSNPKILVFTKNIPVETLIIDEASQIERGDLVPPLTSYHETLRKMVFVGDDNQLAPFGQDDLPKLESVFEQDVLRKRAVFLNTQYRMPVAIGQFISNEVYKGQLRSHHEDKAREACRFVDVYHGVESLVGHSWVNEAECKTVIDVAKILHREGKDFRIITPYDAQRAMVEQRLRKTKIPWQDRVFNVDSFQGNEAPYIVLTLVRSDRIGFLYNKRRTNVMLTRCQQGLIVVSSREFLNTRAERTLAGHMALEWQRYADEAGEELWTGWKRVHNGSLEPGEDEECLPSDAENVPSHKGKASMRAPPEPERPADGIYDWTTGEQRDTTDWSQNSTTVNGSDRSARTSGAANAQRGKAATGRNSRAVPTSSSHVQAPTASQQHDDWSQPGDMDQGQSTAAPAVESDSGNWWQGQATQGASSDWSQQPATGGTNVSASDWSLPNDTDTGGLSEPARANSSQSSKKSDGGRPQQSQPANQTAVPTSDWGHSGGASLSSWAGTPAADDDWSIAPAVQPSPDGGGARSGRSSAADSGRSSSNASRGRGQRGGKGQHRGGRGGRGSRGQ